MRSPVQTTILTLLLFAGACVEAYDPPYEKSDVLGYLTVDGFLDGVSGTATVRLSRSNNVNDYRPNPGEDGASVAVEMEDGTTFKLKEGYNGLYTANNQAFDQRAGYRVRITTKYGSTYTSDYIQMKQSPTFDSLVWRGEEGGVRFFVNGHDDSGKTQYYKYVWTETWNYRAAFFSYYKTVDGFPVPRTKHEYVDSCWDSRHSADVLVAATGNLKKDAISMLSINFVEKGARKLGITYSLLVEQRALSEDEYHFWDLIKKTNQSLGGLFDPIPSAVVGNVRNEDDSDEPVLGFFTGGYPQQKRIFLNYEDLPKDLQTLDPLGYDCGLSDFTVGGDQHLGTNVYIQPHTPPLLYYVTSANCGDCRNLGGDTIRPKYWPRH